MEGGGDGSRGHRVLVDVGGNGCVGGLLLVDAPHLHPARRFTYGTAGVGMARTQHDILREVHPDVGEIKEHVVEEQGAKLNNRQLKAGGFKSFRWT